MVDLKKYSAEGIHEKVLECMEEFPRGSALDVPSGQGAFSKELERLGYKVFLGILPDRIFFIKMEDASNSIWKNLFPLRREFLITESASKG